MDASAVDRFSGVELKQKLVEFLEHAYAQEQVFVQGLSDEDGGLLHAVSKAQGFRNI